MIDLVWDLYITSMVIQTRIIANNMKSHALKIVEFIVYKYNTIIILPIIDIPNPKNLWKTFIVNKFLLNVELFI